MSSHAPGGGERGCARGFALFADGLGLRRLSSPGHCSLAETISLKWSAIAGEAGQEPGRRTLKSPSFMVCRPIKIWEGIRGIGTVGEQALLRVFRIWAWLSPVAIEGDSCRKVLDISRRYTVRAPPRPLREGALGRWSRVHKKVPGNHEETFFTGDGGRWLGWCG